MKRTVILVVVTAMLLALFCGCGGSGSSSSNSGGDIVPGVEVKFAEKGFSVVRPDGTAPALGSKVFKAIKDNTNVSLINSTDAEAVNPNGEILIGNTNRPQSKRALEILKEKATGRQKEYIICYLDGSVVINAMGEEALETAVDKFATEYCKTCVIDSGLCDYFADNGEYKNITLGGKNIGEFRFVVRDVNESYLVTQKIGELRTKLLALTGYDIPMVTDTAEAVADEIVVGPAKRDGVKAITENKDYEIRFEGGKLYVNGGRNYSIVNALELLLTEVTTAGTFAAENKTGSYDKTTTGEYKLIYTDEFETLDTKVWRLSHEQEWGKGSWYGMGVWRSNTTENVNVKDNKLWLTATHDDQNFYGNMVRSIDSIRFIKGYSEISAKIADGEGIWNCFWVYGCDWEDSILEFDVMECWSSADSYVSYIHESMCADGKNVTDMVPACNHITMDNQYESYNDFIDRYVITRKYDKNRTFANAYHTFGCEWTDTEVIISRDGKETLRHKYEGTQNAWLYEEECYLMFSMLVGSNTSNLTEEQSDTSAAIRRPILDADYWKDDRASFIIEYVQLFQKDGQVVRYLKDGIEQKH